MLSFYGKFNIFRKKKTKSKNNTLFIYKNLLHSTENNHLQKNEVMLTGQGWELGFPISVYRKPRPMTSAFLKILYWTCFVYILAYSTRNEIFNVTREYKKNMQFFQFGFIAKSTKYQSNACSSTSASEVIDFLRLRLSSNSRETKARILKRSQKNLKIPQKLWPIIDGTKTTEFACNYGNWKFKGVYHKKKN